MNMWDMLFKYQKANKKSYFFQIIWEGREEGIVSNIKEIIIKKRILIMEERKQYSRVNEIKRERDSVQVKTEIKKKNLVGDLK